VLKPQIELKSIGRSETVMPIEQEYVSYLTALDAEINELLPRIDALGLRMKSVGAAVQSQVELLAAMKIAMRTLTAAQTDARRVLATGEERAHPRSLK
jgi:GTP1/Obg family GTP-binding protein